jgi:prepilin-type N-terminal cleavage/methylation domain-containing protein
MKRHAFTLIEMLVSITILSIMMIFLYKSYAQMNQANSVYETKASLAQNLFAKKKTLFLDFTLAHAGSISIHNQDKHSDVVFMQTSHSLYGRIEPYVAYIKKANHLYRIESKFPFKEYPLTSDTNFFGDSLGEVDTFRLYKNKSDLNTTQPQEYLLHLLFKDKEEILYKLKPLNEY